MRSLFLRIFLWFWVAMVVVAVMLVVTSPFFTRSRPRIERWQRDGAEWAERRLNGVVAIISEGGVNAIDARSRRGRGGGGSNIYVFSKDGEDLRHQEPSRAARNLALRTAAAGSEQTERRGGVHLVARMVTDPEGRQLVVVSTIHRPPGLTDLLEPAALWPRLAGLALIVGLVSFGLARYLAQPVAALRETTHRLGVGDFGARVGPKVARRHDEIGALGRDFDAMAEHVETLIESQRRLLRDVSHELRSPLARLRVALELARARCSGDAEKPLDRIEREATRLDELIGQLLLLERLEAGEPDLDPVDFDLAVLVREVVDDASFEAAPAGRQVGIEAPASCPMRGHPNVVRSAFDNVIRNAIRHTPEGTRVEVRLNRDTGVISASVSDHGDGVPEEYLGSLFEPFTRVAEARDRSSGGAGLGLAIARRAVEIHEGSIVAQNRPDGGLDVLIELPTIPT